MAIAVAVASSTDMHAPDSASRTLSVVDIVQASLEKCEGDLAAVHEALAGINSVGNAAAKRSLSLSGEIEAVAERLKQQAKELEKEKQLLKVRLVAVQFVADRLGCSFDADAWLFAMTGLLDDGRLADQRVRVQRLPWTKGQLGFTFDDDYVAELTTSVRSMEAQLMPGIKAAIAWLIGQGLVEETFDERIIHVDHL